MNKSDVCTRAENSLMVRHYGEETSLLGMSKCITYASSMTVSYGSSSKGESLKSYGKSIIKHYILQTNVQSHSLHIISGVGGPTPYLSAHKIQCPGLMVVHHCWIMPWNGSFTKKQINWEWRQNDTPSLDPFLHRPEGPSAARFLMRRLLMLQSKDVKVPTVARVVNLPTSFISALHFQR